MAKPYAISNGWFSEVYGYPVLKRDCDRPDMGSFNYPKGYPIGVVEHYTAGCGSDLSGIANSRGYVICTFSIDEAAKIYQYTPLFRGAWHAQDASEEYVGIEHSALPGSCALNQKQRAASIALNAAIVLATKNLKGFQIPYVHVGSCNISKAGFKEHADGAMPNRCGWNDKVHTDNPVSWWGGGNPGNSVGKGWDAYLGDIKDTVKTGGEDMTDDQAAQLAQTADFVKNYVRGINGNTQAGNSDQATAGFNAGEFLRRKINELDDEVESLTEAVGSTTGHGKYSDEDSPEG